MSGVLDLSHPLQSIIGLVTPQSSNAPSASPSSSSSQPVTATTAQNTTATSSSGQSTAAATNSSSSSTHGSGVGGEPITTQPQPMSVALQSPKDDSLRATTASTSKNTNYVVAVPTTWGRPSPFEQTNQGWVVFGITWYWWAILVIGVMVAAILINQFFTTRAKLLEKTNLRFKRFLRL